jgi:chromosome segregation ATPase
MAFIVLRRSRNTRSYYLVESYRDKQGKTRRRTFCYLGREQDETDTLAKAEAHWRRAREQARKELRKARGERRQVIRRRIAAMEKRLAVIAAQLQLLAQAEAERKKREQQAEIERRRREQEAEEAVYWQSFEQLRRHPTEEHAKAAKRAFLFLAKRHHPDAGGTHPGFLRLKDAYDRALAVWKRLAS